MDQIQKNSVNTPSHLPFRARQHASRPAVGLGLFLFDRKINHSQKYASFASDQERASAVEKLMIKRAALAKSAAAMASRGIACDPKYLPRSLREIANAAKVA